MILLENQTYTVWNDGIIRWLVESVCWLCKTSWLLTKNTLDSLSKSVAVRCGCCSIRVFNLKKKVSKSIF
jgi:hypothetical protein